jgi:hypothetical protein
MSAAKEAVNTMNDTTHDLWSNPSPSLAAKLAAFFHRHPNTWQDGKTLSLIAGGYGWRTRVSDLRRAPFNMVIENRQRQVKVGDEVMILSEYCFRADVRTEEDATASAPTLTAAV